MLKGHPSWNPCSQWSKQVNAFLNDANQSREACPLSPSVFCNSDVLITWNWMCQYADMWRKKRKLKGKRGSYRDNACLIFFFFPFKGRIKGIVTCSPMLTECYTRTYRKFIIRLDSQFSDGEKTKKISKQSKKKPKPPKHPHKLNKP